MSFSFLGYLHIAPISITFAYLPILAAGCLLGPLESTILGMVFGLASMWKASASYVMAGDKVFSPLWSGSPLESVLLSVGVRMLFGLVIGLLYLGARRAGRFSTLCVAVVSGAGKAIHSMLVYGAMGLLFPEQGYGPLDTFRGFWSWSNLSGIAVSVCVGLLCWKLLRSSAFRKFQSRMGLFQEFQETRGRHRLTLAVLVSAMLLLAAAVALYFVQRMNYVLGGVGVRLTGETYFDLIHLQIQFLLGIIALAFLVGVFLLFNRWNIAYLNYEARVDALTEAFNRKGFFQLCSSLLEEAEPAGSGLERYFLLIDVDWFKQINDRLGHPVGDRVLRAVAQSLRDVFLQQGVVGRLGGDEFAVLVHVAESREQLEGQLDSLMNRFHEIDCGDWRVSGSIGVAPAGECTSAEELYQQADQILYQAKERGRDQYVIGEAAAGRLRF